MKFKFKIFGLVILFIGTLIAHVNLTNPVGGEVFSPGEEITISWDLEIDHGAAVWDLYYSTDGGANWSEIVTGLDKSTLSYQWTIPSVTTTEAKIRVVQNNSNYANLVDESEYFSINTATGINKNIIPEKFEIISQYPNPFNGTTNIEFSLDESSPIEAVVYNLLGQKLERVINKNFTAGIHTIRYSSEKLSSGIYLMALNSKFAVKTVKIIYNK